MDEQKDILEEQVTFQIGDRETIGVLNYNKTEFMVAISGYDLSISFNMDLINSLADAEACANSIADVFYNALMEQLIDQKASFVQPPEDQSSILK